MDVKKLVWESDEETLMITENTQPAILTMSVAALRVLEEKGIKPDVVAGLSLGEYAAHVASGSLDFKEAVKLVKKRGKYMQETVPLGVGGHGGRFLRLARKMLWRAVRRRRRRARRAGKLQLSGQITVAGEIAAVEKCCEIAKEKGAKRAMLLPVSSPFHCSMLIEAGEKLAREMENITVSDMQIPLITNVTGDYLKAKEEIKPTLVKQVSSSVRWEEGVRRMIVDGGRHVWSEVGPGKALCGFMKKTTRKRKRTT